MHFVVHLWIITSWASQLHQGNAATPRRKLRGIENGTLHSLILGKTAAKWSFSEPFKMNVRIKGFLQRTTQKYALREVVQSLSTSYAEEPCKTLLHHLAAQQPPLPKVFQDQQCHDAFKILVFDFLCRSLYTTIHAGWFSSRLKTSWNGELPVWKVSTSILAKPPTKQHIYKSEDIIIFHISTLYTWKPNR